MSIFNKLRAFMAALALVFGVGSANAASVDTALSLAIDISGSISSGEYKLQMQGYANAFKNTAVQDAILDKDGGNRLGQIVVNVVKFSSQAAEQVKFTLLDSKAAINAFADSLATLTRDPFRLGTQTAVARGINMSSKTITDWLNVSGNSAARTVIDVSGDGTDNVDGSSAVKTARDAACNGNVDAINAIAIQSASLETYYDNNVVCGPKSFSLFATGFDTFESAITTKLRAEITGTTPVPLPAAGWMLIAGLGGMIAMRRRQKAAAA